MDGTGIRVRHVLGHLIGDIEPVHVQQIVQNPHVIPFELIELELDDQERPERSEQLVLEHIALGDLFDQRRAKVHALRLVVRVLGETKPFVHVHLGQVDDDGAVARRDVGDIDHPAALDRHRESPGEVRRLDHPSWSRQPATARHLAPCRTSDQG